MPARSGRIEKRIRLAVPVQISSLKDPDATERTTTENVCSLGVRILSQRFRASEERLIISSFVGDLRALAQVVYCQRLPDGGFGVGLRFQGLPVNWSSSSMGDATAWMFWQGILRDFLSVCSGSKLTFVYALKRTGQQRCSPARNRLRDLELPRRRPATPRGHRVRGLLDRHCGVVWNRRDRRRGD